MIELHIRPMEADADGWIEVCLVTQPMDEKEDGSFVSSEDEPEGVTVGHVRIVEGTEGNAPEWWDARVLDADGMHHRRLMGLEDALLALAQRPYLTADSAKLLGW